MKVLLDTNVLLWWLEDKGRLSPAQRRAIAQASPANPLLVSDVSLWEVATLVSLGRVRLSLPIRDWLERATAPPLVLRQGISPAIAAETANLPAGLPRDPADRILVATARILGATLLTADREILESGAAKTIG
ncbi:MAG: type II toxin-antitoxin system VapC family toxin [Planctomycetota bacterium]